MGLLTKDKIATYRKALDADGYFVLKDVVSLSGLEAFRERIEAEFAKLKIGGALFDGGGLYSGHLNCVPGKAARFAYDDIVRAGIVDFVSELDGSWAARPRATMNYNLPGSHAQHYHMDGVFLKDFLICNVAVVDTTLVNGALDVLPGTNRSFLRFWQYALRRKFRTTTRVPLQQGDVVVRRSTLWHRGMPNDSELARAMLAFTFGETEAPNPDPFADATDEMEFYPNWFRPTKIGRLRERIFVAAPISYSAYRFSRSLFSNKGYAS